MLAFPFAFRVFMFILCSSLFSLFVRLLYAAMISIPVMTVILLLFTYAAICHVLSSVSNYHMLTISPFVNYATEDKITQSPSFQGQRAK